MDIKQWVMDIKTDSNGLWTNKCFTGWTGDGGGGGGGRRVDDLWREGVSLYF